MITKLHRLDEYHDTRMKRMLDIPHAQRLSHEYDIAFESGWFEETLECMEVESV